MKQSNILDKKENTKKQPSAEEAKEAVRTLISWAGDDPEREGLLDTPKRVIKASCHVGYKSCFYRKIETKNGNVSLKFTEKKKSFDPNIVYKGIANPTKI